VLGLCVSEMGLSEACGLNGWASLQLMFCACALFSILQCQAVFGVENGSLF